MVQIHTIFPAVMDLSTDLRHVINTMFFTDDAMLSKIIEMRWNFLSRFQCRLWWFPFGTVLPGPLLEHRRRWSLGNFNGGLTRCRQMFADAEAELAACSL